jgi:hypothetical protein
MELISRLKPKKVYPKVYAMVLVDSKGYTRKVWLGCAYTYEDAIIEAINSAVQTFPTEPGVQLWKPSIYDIIEPEELFEGFLENQIKIEKQTKEEKNNLMKTIVESKDKNLYLKNKHKFSKEERLLLEEKIK